MKNRIMCSTYLFTGKWARLLGISLWHPILYSSHNNNYINKNTNSSRAHLRESEECPGPGEEEEEE